MKRKTKHQQYGMRRREHTKNEFFTSNGVISQSIQNRTHTHTCPKKTHTYAVVRGKEIKKENLNWATHMGCLSIDRRPNGLH